MQSAVIISSRLLPAVSVAGATVSVEQARRINRDGKPEWNWYVDLPDGREFSGAEFWGRGDAGQMLETLLSFLLAAGEAYRYEIGTGRKSDNAGLFDPDLTEWCYSVSDDIAAVSLGLADENAARRDAE